MSEYLTCDVPGCDHTETVPVITEELVGKPCPKCGADLLTQPDYDHWVRAVRPGIAAMVDLGIVAIGSPHSPPEQRIRVNYHDGELRIKAPTQPREGEP